MKRLFLLFLLAPLLATAQVIIPGAPVALSAIVGASAPPSGAAGGVLSGTYPNPGFAANAAFTSMVTIDLGSGSLPTDIFPAGTTILRLGNSNSSGNIFESESFGSATGYQVAARASAGTRASPSATAANTVFINLSVFGFSNALTTSGAGNYQIYTPSLWSVSNTETAHKWLGTPNGSTTRSTWMTLTGSGLSVALPVTAGAAGTAMTNIRHGITTALSGGTLVVSDAGATANTRYFFTTHTLGTVVVPSAYYVSARSAGVSFTITSNQATDTSTVDWLAIEP